MRQIIVALVATWCMMPAAHAQPSVTVRADNDAFNFWQMPWDRSDEEYTSGVRLTIAVDGAARWARPLRWALGECPTNTKVTCASRTYAIGQDIYTAARPENVATAIPGGRPDAGVLWMSFATQVVRGGAENAVGFTIGVTGAPSLAQPMQQFFHSLAPQYNRAITWGAQIPAEPVFSVRWDRARTIGQGAISIRPHGGVSLGTLLTEARVGVGARYTNSQIVSWLLPRRIGPVGVLLETDAQLRSVARNAVLSGTFFRESPRIPLRPLVPETSAGLRLQWRALEGGWIMHRTGAEHIGRRQPHEWSTLVLSWRPRP